MGRLGLGLGIQLGIGMGFRHNHSWSSTFMPRCNHSLCLDYKLTKYNAIAVMVIEFNITTRLRLDKLIVVLITFFE